MSSSKHALLLIGLLFHAIYTYSIFDIYFTSPIVHGMPDSYPTTTTPGTQNAPARRLVLLVADGLRADTLFSNPDVAPCLHSIIRSQGIWGVSHTRVPTESRPGHVALLAGMYEDVSAVTKGWKLNPVNFDSMVNASSSSFMFGSPDILPMFVTGAHPFNAQGDHRIHAHMYSSSLEDFASNTNNSALDRWVFDQFNLVLKANLTHYLHHDHLFIFLHLLGLDTNGHAFGPNSQQYSDNLALVDQSIAHLVKEISLQFPDNQTAYVFTSDHGMHTRGNHGDGDPQNTLTPLVAWGAGIRTPISNISQESNIMYPNGSMGLSPTYAGVNTDNWPTHSLRRDVNQADIAALMAALLGTRFPLNNVGILPRDLLADPDWARAAFRANTLQILHMYRTKATLRREHEPNYVPYPHLSVLEHVPNDDLEQVVDYYFKGYDGLHQLMQYCLLGLDYLQTYDWIFLRTVVTLGYIGWMAYALSHVIYLEPTLLNRTQIQRSSNYIISLFTIPFAFLISTFLYVKAAPITYYAYTLLAIYMWDATIRKVSSHVSQTVSPDSPSVFACVAYVLSLEMLVFSYQHRWVLLLISIALSARPWWTAVFLSNDPSRSRWWQIIWSMSLLICGAFTLLPIVGQETQVDQLCLGVVLLLVLGITSTIKFYRQKRPVWKIYALQQVLCLIAALNVAWIVKSFSTKTGLPVVAQTISWLILLISPATHIIILFSPKAYHVIGNNASADIIERVISMAFAVAPIYVTLSTAYELAFVICYTVACVAWAGIECEQAKYQTLQTSTKKTSIGDIVAAFTYLYLIHLGFFGTGNIASLSSFTLASVYRLVTVFSPFTMGALLVLKVILPFIISSASFRVVALARTQSMTMVVKATQIKDPFTLFILVVATCDVLTIHFFWLVRDHGSWLEIGTSISHFGIASSFLVVLFILYAVCGLALGRVLVPKVKVN